MVSDVQVDAIAMMAARAIDQTLNNYPGNIENVPRQVLTDYYVLGFANAIIHQIGEASLAEAWSEEVLLRVRDAAYPKVRGPISDALARFTAYLEEYSDNDYECGYQDGLICAAAVSGDLSEVPLPMLKTAAETASANASSDDPTHSAIAAALLVNTLYQHLSELSVAAHRHDVAGSPQQLPPSRSDQFGGSASFVGSQPSDNQPLAPGLGERADSLSMRTIRVPPGLWEGTNPHKVFFATMAALVALTVISDSAVGGAYLGLTTAMLFDFPTFLLAIPIALYARPYRSFLALALLAGLALALYRVVNLEASTPAGVDRPTLSFAGQLTAVLILAHGVNLLHFLPWRTPSRPPRY